MKFMLFHDFIIAIQFEFCSGPFFFDDFRYLVKILFLSISSQHINLILKCCLTLFNCQSTSSKVQYPPSLLGEFGGAHLNLFIPLATQLCKHSEEFSLEHATWYHSLFWLPCFFPNLTSNTIHFLQSVQSIPRTCFIFVLTCWFR